MDDKPLDEFELLELATYNAETARGIMHRQEWRQKMHGLQERFNKRGHDARVPKPWWECNLGEYFTGRRG